MSSYQKNKYQLIQRLNNVYENEECANNKKKFNEWISSDLRGFES